jgi:hypothetical protein
MRVTLIRTDTGDQGTFGYFVHPDLLLRTCELPWRDNHRNVSCIPAGRYQVVPYHSRKFGAVWHVLDVPGRSSILIHCGNVAGDVTLGWHTHSEGCILIGKYLGHLTYNNRQQRAVLSSKAAMRELNSLGREPFELEIINGGI